jgi:hypothetical protein
MKPVRVVRYCEYCDKLHEEKEPEPWRHYDEHVLFIRDAFVILPPEKVAGERKMARNANISGLYCDIDYLTKHIAVLAGR